MNAKDLKTKLRSYGIGGFFGSGIRLFDKNYDVISFSEMDRMVSNAMGKLAKEGLDPYSDYSESIADCDNWSMWIQSEVTKAWALKMKHGNALAFGRCLVTGHDLNIGVTESGIKIWNYGQLTVWDLKKIKEVEFK
jgi:hypothetical protein